MAFIFGLLMMPKRIWKPFLTTLVNPWMSLARIIAMNPILQLVSPPVLFIHTRYSQQSNQSNSFNQDHTKANISTLCALHCKLISSALLFYYTSVSRLPNCIGLALYHLIWCVSHCLVPDCLIPLLEHSFLISVCSAPSCLSNHLLLKGIQTMLFKITFST